MLYLGLRDGQFLLRYVDCHADAAAERAAGARMIRLKPEEARFRSIFSDLDLLSLIPDTPTNKKPASGPIMYSALSCAKTLLTTPCPGVKLEPVGRHGTSPDCRGCHTRPRPDGSFF